MPPMKRNMTFVSLILFMGVTWFIAAAEISIKPMEQRESISGCITTFPEPGFYLRPVFSCGKPHLVFRFS